MAEKEPCRSLSPCSHCHCVLAANAQLEAWDSLPAEQVESCRVESGWLIPRDPTCALVALCKLLTIVKPCWIPAGPSCLPCYPMGVNSYELEDDIAMFFFFSFSQRAGDQTQNLVLIKKVFIVEI